MSYPVPSVDPENIDETLDEQEKLDEVELDIEPETI
jgi:hypothetical protein